MPRYKRRYQRKRRYNKRKRYPRKTRKTRNKQISTLRLREPSVMPDRFFVKLKYEQLGQLILNNSSTGSHEYRGNGCFDPDLALGGHQPLGFDQFSAFYNRYRVHASSVKMELQRTSDSFVWCLCPTLTSSTPSVQTLIETPYARYRVVSSSISNHMLAHKMYTKKIYGQRITQDDVFSALTTADPSRKWYWSISAQSYNGSSQVTAYYNIRLMYYVEFFDRTQLSAS